MLAAGCATARPESSGGEPAGRPGARSHKDATYVIAGRAITLTDGVSDIEAAPDSASRIVTRHLGPEVWHDLDGDGREDVAFVLTQQTGGSGTFYYVVAALQTERGFVGSHAWLLGDRIALQRLEISGDGAFVVVSYADRRPGESFAAPPSVARRVSLRLDPTTMRLEEAR